MIVIGDNIAMKHYNVGKDNPMYGKIFTDTMRKNYSITKLGDKNPIWKGDDVGLKSLHGWIRNNLPKPDRCQKCNKKEKRLDAANISGEYHRDLSDWEYLCRVCHMLSDGRMRNRDKNGRFSRKV